MTRWDIFMGCLGATAPLLAVLLAIHLQNRSDKKSADNRMAFLLGEHPLHSHTEVTPDAEPSDALTVRGVRYPRKANGA